MSLQLYPAIDLRGGKCVRLMQGDYGRETVYGDDPVAQARHFADAGAEWIHVVDLDAARTGDPVNRPVVAAIAAAVDIPVQTGGGVRTIDAAQALFDAGVTRVVIGTAAVENPALAGQLTARGHRVAIGLDARNGRIATHGWETETDIEVVEMARRFQDLGVDAVVVTEIARDGTLEGPDVEGLRTMLAGTTLDVIASGGIGSTDHLSGLAALRVEGRALSGVIVGRAIYEGTVDLEAALTACRGVRPR
jgi:phosphoribosylformimino-5-aminoimidazole carboxamide ribotide isomerase